MNASSGDETLSTSLVLNCDLTCDDNVSCVWYVSTEKEKIDLLPHKDEDEGLRENENNNNNNNRQEETNKTSFSTVALCVSIFLHLMLIICFCSVNET